MNNPYQASTPDYTATYTQEYTYDSAGLGNMMRKKSWTAMSRQKTVGDGLDYDFDYEYEEGYVHRLKRAGTRYYKYDANGNVILEREGKIDTETSGAPAPVEAEQKEGGVYGYNYGWALKQQAAAGGGNASGIFQREYTWNERNLMAQSSDTSYTVVYKYGADA